MEKINSSSRADEDDWYYNEDDWEDCDDWREYEEEEK